MNKNIYPCLWFEGNAKEAAEFYCAAIKKSKITTDTPMVVMFEISSKTIMGLNGGPRFRINPSISFFILCESINETNELWDKLIDGGKALMPINKYPWSERYGWVQDKFGMTWQVSVVYKEGDKQQLTPSMLFTGNQFGKAEEAIHLYISLFKNSEINPLILYHEGDPNAGKVMYSEFKLNGYPMIAMDGPGEHEYSFNEGVSIVVNCDTQEEIDHYWNKLIADGGEESMCGWLKDKFGVSWQIVPSILGELMTDPKRSDRVIQAFLKMKKFDIEKLLQA